MKPRTSFLKRCVAFALALVLMVSAVDAGVVLRVLAADGDENTITAGALVANNYELTDAENALLTSGLLAGGSYSYTVPSDAEALITVDTDNHKITAAVYNGWVATTAYIVADGATVESIALTDGVGYYDPAVGNAFSVKVDYTLSMEVPEATQTTLLNTAAWLQNGVNNLKAGYAADTNLGTVVLAMDTLVQLANGIKMNFGAFTMTAQFGADAIAAVKALDGQRKVNGDKLNLQVKNAAYNTSASKVQFLLENGAAYKTELTDTYNYLNAIKNDPLANNNLLDSYLQGSDPASYTKWMAFKKILSNLVSALEPVAAADWTAAQEGTALVKTGITAQEYVALDNAVAALGTVTAAPAVKNPLVAAEVSLQKNMSMFNVTVNVTLQVVQNKVDSAVLVTYGTKSVVLTLAENATAEQIMAEIDASGIVADAQAAWGAAYVAEHYTASATELPDALTQDITYAVTYAPVEYTVSYGYTTDAPTTVPYGYQLTLPVHADITKAYDYDINGVRYAQGDIYTVTGNTEISRSTGKAYVSTDLYTIVANNYGNDIAKAILTSGALYNNVVIAYREPDPADAESLLKLFAGELTAKNYDAKYQGLSWAPYTYGVNGNENAFVGTSAEWADKSVKVQYILELTNFSEAQVAEILALAATLKNEANEQKTTLDRLAAYHSTIGQLDKTKLGALNGVIDVTDFTPGDNTDTDAGNMEMRAYFKGLVGGIIANNLDSNNQLKIYNILSKYLDEGLRYYYSNNNAVIAEIDSLAGYLSGMLADEEKIAALEIMVTQAGFPEYAEKITDLEKIMSEVRAALSAPNAAINLSSANLGKLMDALSAEGEVVTKPAGNPYLLSKVLTAMDSSQVMVQVILEAGSESATITTATMDRGTVLTEEVIAELVEKINAKASELLGGNVACYDLTVEGTPVEELIGTELNEQLNIYYTYTAKEYTVKIDGEADQIITIDNLEVKLPAHPTTGWTYKYTIDGQEGITTSSYTFTVAQLNSLFVDGTYTITRVAINETEEKLEGTFADWIVKDENGNIVGLHADVDGDKDGFMDFAMKLVNSGYTYIGLNGEALLYLNEENTLEISLQTLLNAILSDNTFGSETLIALGENGKGKLVAASLQLGNSADDIFYNDLDFVMSLNSVPAQMSVVSNGLSSIENYITFQSQDGVLNIHLNLPAKIYEFYLTALLPTGIVDMDNLDAVNTEIAVMFLWDYVDLIINSDANTTTFSNTLAMLNHPYDLTGGEEYYQMVKKMLTNEGVVINPDEDGIFDVDLSAKGQKGINALIGFFGIDTSAFDTYLGMIKEYKYEDAELSVSVDAYLDNTNVKYEALLLDLNAAGISNKLDYTTDLAARVNNIADKAVVILLDDVDGNLTFNGTTILDLNGMTLNGSITSNGTLYIVDSYLDSTDCGYVTGNVTGNVVVVGGKYDCDVTSFLKDGYVQEDGAVHNALFRLESDGTNVTMVINMDVASDSSVAGYLPNTRAMAVEAAVELLMNYFTCASISGDGNTIYDVNVDDILALLNSSTKIDDLINDCLNTVDAKGISAFANIILADILDFAAIESAIANNQPIATYTMSIAPWAIELEHVTDGDYITFGIGSNADLAKSFTIGLKLAGDNKAKLEKFYGALADIVTAEATVNLEQPTYDEIGNGLSVVGSASASAVVDLTVDEDYLTVLTVILANGNPANKADLIAALNAGNEDDLKDAIDALTVKNVFDALKALSRNTNFQTMASNLGVTIDVAHAAELESIFHLMLCGSGKLLEVVKVTGTSTTLGSLDADDDGVYEWTGDATRSPDASYRGYTVYTETSVEVSLTLKLFSDCLWGDANHDDVVNGKDATLILQYYAGLIGDEDLCLKRTDVNGDGAYNGKDASLILQYYAGEIEKFPVEE